MTAAFAGIASTLETNYFWPTVGSGAMLPTVAAVFLGGTSIFGGRGTIFGTFVAAFVIGAIEPGIVSLGWTGLLTQVIYGAVIVGALIMQSLVMKRVQALGAALGCTRGGSGRRGYRSPRSASGRGQSAAPGVRPTTRSPSKRCTPPWTPARRPRLQRQRRES